MWLCDLAYWKATAQWKNNSNTFFEVEWWGTQNEPRIKLPEGPFVHSCQASEKGMGIHLHGFLYWGKCLVNDVGDSLHHLTDILYDAFYVTTLQCRYVTYWHRSMGRNCIMGKWWPCSQDWRPWLRTCQCKKVSHDLPENYRYTYFSLD